MDMFKLNKDNPLGHKPGVDQKTAHLCFGHLLEVFSSHADRQTLSRLFHNLPDQVCLQNCGQMDNADQNASLFGEIRLASGVKIPQTMIRRAGNRHNNDRAGESQGLRREANKMRSQKQLLQSSEKEEQS
jgi:hypothetical protein